MPSLDLWFIIGGCLLALGSIVAAAVAWRGESGLIAMQDTPTSSVAEVVERHRWAAHGVQPFGEPVEVVGTIECDAPLQAPYSEKLCVAYSYAVSEEHERRIGRTAWSPGREIETHSHGFQDQRVPRFYVRDASGRIAVDTAGATLDMLETAARYAQFTGLGGVEREIWREERALLLGHRVYVLGYLTDAGGEPAIARHPLEAGRRFLISHRDEQAFAGAVRRRAYSLYLAGGLGLGGAIVLLLAAFLA